MRNYNSPLPNRAPRLRAWLPETGAQTAFLVCVIELTMIGGIGVFQRRRLFPHAHWFWGFLAFGFWFVAQLTPIRLDDRTQKAWMVGMLFAILALCGLFGGMSPASISWWLLAVIWELALAEAILEGLRDQRGLQLLFISLGWYLLAVLA